MKKVLLATTGLVGAAFVASAAFADSGTPKVTVGGFVDFQAGYVDNDGDIDGFDTGHAFRNDTEISFSIDGESASGLGYGAVVDLEADVSDDADNEGANAARTYIYMDGSWGRFELGSNQGAASTMSVDADNIAAATGGTDGAWTYFAANPGAPFITTAALNQEHGSVALLGDEETDNSNKITYYSPRMSGIQLGVSYTPDMNDRGQFISANPGTLGLGTNGGDVFDIALGYEGQWDEIGLDLSGVYSIGDSDNPTALEDISAWQVGGVFGFAGFDIAGSYGDWGDSLLASGSDATYYTVGLGFDAGMFGVSATFLDSTLDDGTGDNDFQNIVLGADYTLAPGLTPYAEVSMYEFDGAGTANDDEGTIFLLGTQLAF